MKKLALLLALVLCTGLMAPLATGAEEAAKPIVTEFEALKEIPKRTIGVDCYDSMENGNAEVFDDGERKLYNWEFSSPLKSSETILGCEYFGLAEDVLEGENTIHVRPKEGSRVMVGPYGTVIPGETYELTVWYKKLTATGTTGLIVQPYGTKNGVSLEYEAMRLSLDNTAVKDTWVQSGIRFVAPEYANSVLVWLNFVGPGEILWDNVSLLCITNEMPKPEMAEKLPAISYCEVTDPGFESVAVGEPIGSIPGWETYGAAKISDKYAHTGEKSLELYNKDTTGDSIGLWCISGIEEGATYQISAHLLNPSPIKTIMSYWLKWSMDEEYSEANTSRLLGTVKPNWRLPTSEVWQEYVAEFVAPKGANSAGIYFRHRLSPGYIYMDDVQIYKVKEPSPVHADTDAVFYYSDWKTGKATVTPSYISGDATKYRTEFAFIGLSGETLLSETVTGLAAPGEFEFPVSLMAEKGKRYYISVKVYNPDGVLCQEESLPVHRYDRPTYLGADGIFRKNGKEFPIISGTGVNMKYIDKVPGAGVVAVQLVGGDNEYNMTIEETADYFWEKGMYIIFTCYSGEKTAGHEAMMESVKKKVETFKDHPATLAWKIVDEPFQKAIPEEEMMRAYQTIRDIDPHHPIITAENVQGSYDWVFKYSDFFNVDYYGHSPYEISVVVDLVQASSKGRKPYDIMLQFFDYGAGQPFPSFDKLRHMTYQGLFSGAYGYSYFTLGLYDGPYDNTVPGVDWPQWQETKEKWVPWERDFALGCFVTGEYKFVNYQKTEEYIWGTFTDGTDLYAIVLNRSDKAACHVDIPLQDGTGTLKVDGFSAVAMTGDTTRALTGAGTLSLDLAPWEATVWKVTPTGAPLSAEHLKDTSFNDIITYPWAYNAIATLEEKGIVNRVSDQWYGPGENITRGDFAMFLVRTLGLSGEGENFADVAEDAEYAKELAIGKAAGVLNGVGDNQFNPEAKITRQDMMTMTSRALALSGSADLAGFSDAASIADYARVHVAAMVEKGLIKGNADGTINPLGNTTRAEAAVIMQRILNN